ncbi:MAG TPA: tetratricopeptide repeat protein [Candidatus Eisenbacteria bacterium]|nr:tetratricopeptide repeat protein [Candidatus Eisenbacteria bacterium]
MRSRVFILLFSLVFIAVVCLGQDATQPAPAPGSAADPVQRGLKLSREGKQDDALALYEQALGRDPNSYQAQLESGIALDLKGEYAKAQEHFNKAVEIAPAESKEQALRSLTFSYAFQGDAFKAAEPEMQVFNARLAKGDVVAAGEACNELARIYLELGDPDHAFKWYKMGYDTVSRKADLSDADKNLWLFRWESAQARVAARRGNIEEAQQHVRAAKPALDKANNPDQMRFYPYLVGYVAFYGGDYKTAVSEFQKADQRDPFILVMLAQAYEKSGDEAQAKDYYHKVLDINVHNPTNAFARPLAKKKLQTGA